MKNPSDADLLPDQTLLVPAIIATVIQLLCAYLITKKSHTIHFVFILIK